MGKTNKEKQDETKKTFNDIYNDIIDENKTVSFEKFDDWLNEFDDARKEEKYYKKTIKQDDSDYKNSLIIKVFYGFYKILETEFYDDTSELTKVIKNIREINNDIDNNDEDIEDKINKFNKRSAYLKQLFIILQQIDEKIKQYIDINNKIGGFGTPVRYKREKKNIETLNRFNRIPGYNYYKPEFRGKNNDTGYLRQIEITYGIEQIPPYGDIDVIFDKLLERIGTIMWESGIINITTSEDYKDYNAVDIARFIGDKRNTFSFGLEIFTVFNDFINIGKYFLKRQKEELQKIDDDSLILEVKADDTYKDIDKLIKSGTKNKKNIFHDQELKAFETQIAEYNKSIELLKDFIEVEKYKKIYKKIQSIPFVSNYVNTNDHKYNIPDILKKKNNTTLSNLFEDMIIVKDHFLQICKKANKELYDQLMEVKKFHYDAFNTKQDYTISSIWDGSTLITNVGNKYAGIDCFICLQYECNGEKIIKIITIEAKCYMAKSYEGSGYYIDTYSPYSYNHIVHSNNYLFGLYKKQKMTEYILALESLNKLSKKKSTKRDELIETVKTYEDLFNEKDLETLKMLCFRDNYMLGISIGPQKLGYNAYDTSKIDKEKDLSLKEKRIIYYQDTLGKGKKYKNVLNNNGEFLHYISQGKIPKNGVDLNGDVAEVWLVEGLIDVIGVINITQAIRDNSLNLNDMFQDHKLFDSSYGISKGSENIAININLFKPIEFYNEKKEDYADTHMKELPLKTARNKIIKKIVSSKIIL